MKRHRHVPRPQPVLAARPFADAEEAWFWFVRAHRARRNGQRFEGSGEFARPCEADDIYLAARNLVRVRVLTMGHLRTLLEFGFRDRPPDDRLREEESARRLWDEALDRLTTVLRRKGIIA